jgi:hypothetical protein
MLQEIKDRVNQLVNFENASDYDLYYMSKKHINWLIEKAEENEKLTRIAIEASEGCEYWRDKYKQAQKRIQYLENELKNCGYSDTDLDNDFLWEFQDKQVGWEEE